MPAVLSQILCIVVIIAVSTVVVLTDKKSK